MAVDVPIADVIMVGASGGDYQRMLAQYARTYGLTSASVDLYRDFYTTAHAVKRARFVVIWNGMQGIAPLAAECCRQRGIPHCFIEYGVSPQADTILVDLAGFCGRSMLCGPLHWLTRADREGLARERAYWSRKHPRRDERYVLVPLQLENDSQVLFSSPFRDMGEVIAYAEDHWPRQEIIVRPHPKARTTLPTKRARWERGSGGDFLHWAAGASVVVGINSTALAEAAILGVPVHALGACPLAGARTPERVDDVLAGMLALRMPRTNPDLARILERFGVRPLGSACPF
jgi:hypothetical protein